MKRLNGVHLAHNKGTEHIACVQLPLPAKVRIPMLMNMGAPCTPLVKVGDLVQVGQKIGDTEAPFSVPVHASVSGTVTAITEVLSANGSTMLWAPNSTKAETYVSNDNGKTWYVANGLGYQPKMAADKVNPSKIYAACGGQVFASEDGGFNFAPTGALVSDTTTLYTVDGREGHVWALSGSIIMFSQDGGKTFENLKNFNAKAMGFGAPKNAGDYPVLYAMGSSDNVNGIFRSADQGKTWQRINDDKHQFGNITPYICGDGSVYGKVYFATNGRGIVMGDIAE